MNKEERKVFRETYGYEVYEQEGDFDKLVTDYIYDASTKKLVRK